MSASGDSLRKASTHGSSSSRVPRPIRSAKPGVQYYSKRAELELDQPLEPLERLFAQPAPVKKARIRVKRGRSYWPADPEQVKRSYRRNLILGFILIALMVGGAIFGVIFSLVETHGDFAAANSYLANPNYTDITALSGAVSTTFIPSHYPTLVPSSFSTLVPSEVTLYVQSEATTLVLSQVTTFVPSEITLFERGAKTATVEQVNVNPAGLVKKSDEVISTTGVTLSITTTVTVEVSRTAFGLHELQSNPGTNSEVQRTRGNEDYDGGCTQNASISSAIVTSPLQDFSLSTNLMPDGPDGGHITTPLLTTMETVAINPDTTAVDKVTVTFTDMCAVADISSLLPCNPLPTGWYISPSAPRATSILHPLFHLLSVFLYRVKDGSGSGYHFLYHSVTTILIRGVNLLARLVSDSGSIGKILDVILGLLPRYQ